MTGERWTIFDRLGFTMGFHARQMQKHREARRALHQSTDRRATKAENKVTLPCVDAPFDARDFFNGSNM